MRRISTLATATAAILFLIPAVDAQQQEQRKPAAPMLTNDDVLSPRSGRSASEDAVSRNNLSGSPLRNPRTVLEDALTRIGEVNSVRMRLQTSLPSGQREVTIETMKPDRTHVISPYGEMIVIGRKFYVKGAGGWEVSSAPAGAAQSDSGLDFRTLVKQLTGKAGVRITGQVLGGQTVDGVETVAYEFAVADANDSGTIQISVGKEDGYMRQMFISGGGVDIKIWFTSINESLLIEPPM